MKYVFLLLIFAAPLAFAEGETVTPPKTEETLTLPEEVTAPLFDRTRGAHLRAQQSGKVEVAAKTGK